MHSVHSYLVLCSNVNNLNARKASHHNSIMQLTTKVGGIVHSMYEYKLQTPLTTRGLTIDWPDVAPTSK